MAIAEVKTKSPWCRVYDEKFNKITEMSMNLLGEFKNVVGDNILFVKGPWLRTYDKKFKKINERTNR